MAPRNLWELPYAPPLDWNFFLRYLGLRATPGVESVDDDRYSRSFTCGERVGTLSVSHHPTDSKLVVATDVEVEPDDAVELQRRIRRMFDLDADMASVHRTLGPDPILKPLLDASPGIRIPGAWSEFELLVRTIVGQQVTVKAATTIMGRIAERLGTPLAETATTPTLLFPSPDAVADGRLDTIGMPSRRVLAVQGVARAITESSLRFPRDGQGFDEAKRDLLKLPGIGPWTVAYFALRGLREADSWPETDLVLRRSLEEHAASGRAGGTTAESWRPYRGYAAMHLWNESAQSMKTQKTGK